VGIFIDIGLWMYALRSTSESGILVICTNPLFEEIKILLFQISRVYLRAKLAQPG